jgi:long-subunit fatty acid transport protein
MKNKDLTHFLNRLFWVVLVVIQATIGPHVAAQSKTGTTIGQFLLLEPSARMAGMGNAGVTDSGEITAVFFNPAALAKMQKTGFQLSRNQWFLGITQNYGAASINMGNSALFLSVNSLNSGDIAVRTVEKPDGTGELYSVQDMAFGVGYGRKLTDRFAAGAQVKWLQERIWHSSLRAIAMDVGVQYDLPKGLILGASISNFGSNGKFAGRDLRVRFDQNTSQNGDNSSLPAALETESFPLPVLFRVGLAYPYKINKNNEFKLMVDAFHPSDNTESISFGAEYKVLDAISLRAGYQNLFQKDNEFGLTAGAGLQYEWATTGLSFDYAWVAHKSLGNTHRFSVGVNF